MCIRNKKLRRTRFVVLNNDLAQCTEKGVYKRKRAIQRNREENINRKSRDARKKEGKHVLYISLCIT